MTFRVYDTDALALLAALPDHSIDHVYTDPPYNKASRNARSVYDGKASDSSLGRSALGVKGSGIAWDLTPEMIRLLTAEFIRVARRWIIVHCALEHLGAFCDAAEKHWTRAGVWLPDDDGPIVEAGLWDRNNTGTPQLTGDRPAQAAEGIAILHGPGKKRWNGRGKRGVWRQSVCRERGRHPAEKPLALCSQIVVDFTDPGESILDPFCGRGALGLAAVRAGRSFVGCDNGARDTDGARWADLARERLATG